MLLDCSLLTPRGITAPVDEGTQRTSAFNIFVYLYCVIFSDKCSSNYCILLFCSVYSEICANLFFRELFAINSLF